VSDQEVTEVRTTTRPAFRKPWTHGAKAYHEADSLAAIRDGLGRLRKPLTVLIHHERGALAGVPCAACGKALDGPYLDDSDHVDRYAMVDVDPRSKTYVTRHYYCAWGAVMNKVMKLREVMG
jgi:hypothetical protein